MSFKFPQIAKEGHIFILIFAIITVTGFFVSNIIGLLCLLLTLGCALFFRDPIRITPQKEDAVIAPADGIVKSIEVTTPPKDIGSSEEEMLKISIFMSLFNVHINRTPINGLIKTISYIPGKFFNASLDKTSQYNERQSFFIESTSGINIIVVQIAGLIARRIIKFVDEGTQVKAGEKIGLIRFGSRVDLYLPKNITPLVITGQTVIGGETILASLKDNQPEAIQGNVADRATSKVSN